MNGAFLTGLSMNPRSDSRAGPRSIVNVGVGLAGLAVARKLVSAQADILVIARYNYNLFHPLPIAWLLWDAVHIYPVTGFPKRVAVFLNFVWAWLTYGRGARMITGEKPTRANAPQVLSVYTQPFGRS